MECGLLWYGPKTKVVICSKETFNNAQQSIASRYDDIKKHGAKERNIQLVSFGEVEGITNISAKLQDVDEDKAPKPEVMEDCIHLRACDSERKNVTVYRRLKTSHIFFAAKQQWKKHRNYPIYARSDFQFHGWNFLPMRYLKERVLLPFTALEDRRPCWFLGCPFDADEYRRVVDEALDEFEAEEDALDIYFCDLKNFYEHCTWSYGSFLLLISNRSIYCN